MQKVLAPHRVLQAGYASPMRPGLPLLLFALPLACGPTSGTDGTGAGTDATGDSNSDSNSSSAGPGSGVTSDSSSGPGTTSDSGTTSGTSTTGSTTDDTATGGGFCAVPPGPFAAHCSPDFGGGSLACDTFAQDCPDGEKCTPWANDGGNTWNTTKCTPVAPDPDQVGEPCTMEGSPVSGIDSCDVGVMCWNVDPDTLEGTCVELCGGTPDQPVCNTPMSACAINSGAVQLCITTCDPLMSDCPDGELCVPSTSGSNFVCVADGSMGGGQAGETCEYINVCAPGHVCIDPSYVESCQGGVGCCAPYCDITDPNVSCPGATEECIPWYEQGMAPAGYENVGVCAIPQ